MTKIYSPNKEYTGVVAGVPFNKGAGETEDRWLINWFKEKGYSTEVVEVPESEETEEEKKLREEAEAKAIEEAKVLEEAKDKKSAGKEPKKGGK